ncbi:MAG: type II toxin-antitoxin system VapC family toxin [Deltaproteobacteria bacterium]|nr:type II toxin-antitoxin system VapC family toxin [Deltaproteobacteria bacterium]
MPERFVVDNSVVMAWCFQDEADRYADGVLDMLVEGTALVPAIWPLEIGNVLVAAERKKRLSKADSARLLALLTNLPITIVQESPERMLTEIVALARLQQLSTYDATYLDLAMREDIPLATRDKALLAAARRCRVPVVK